MFITDRDTELLGSTSARDPMGVLPVWSDRGRELVPHLTEQTTAVEGFQVLLTAFWLFEHYRAKRSGVERSWLPGFFLLVEQAFAHAYFSDRGQWPLPGSRRVRARAGSPVRLSLFDESHHLLGRQLQNGIWGLYRGAAGRAGLLVTPSLDALDAGALEAFEPTLPRVWNGLFNMIDRAFDAELRDPEFPGAGSDRLVEELATTLTRLPQRALIANAFIPLGSRCHRLAEHLSLEGADDLRTFLVTAQDRLPEDAAALEQAFLCECFLAPLEATFLYLCANKGWSLSAVAAKWPGDVAALRPALEAFKRSGPYTAGVARLRFERYQTVDLTSAESFLDSVIEVHLWVSRKRRKAPWLLLDGGLLRSEWEVEAPSAAAFNPSLSWRNPYYLDALHGVATRLADAA